MRQIIKNVAILSGTCAFVYIIWIVLAALSNISLILGFLSGIVLTFITPAVVMLLISFVNPPEIPTDFDAVTFVSTVLSSILMIASILTVPFFMEHDTCESTFESAYNDTQQCDYLCFESLTPIKEKAFSFTYDYKMQNEPKTGKSYYIPVETPPDVFMYTRGKPTDDIRGNCFDVGGDSHDYNYLNPYSQNRAILGRIVEDPDKDRERKRGQINIGLLIVICLLTIGLFLDSRRKTTTS